MWHRTNGWRQHLTGCLPFLNFSLKTHVIKHISSLMYVLKDIVLSRKWKCNRLLELKDGNKYVVDIISIIMIISIIIIIIIIVSSEINFVLHRKLIDIRSSEYRLIHTHSCYVLQLVLLKISFESMFLYTTKRNAFMYLVCSIKNGTQWTTIPKIYVLLSCIFGCKLFTGCKLRLWVERRYIRTN